MVSSTLFFATSVNVYPNTDGTGQIGVPWRSCGCSGHLASREIMGKRPLAVSHPGVVTFRGAIQKSSGSRDSDNSDTITTQ